MEEHLELVEVMMVKVCVSINQWLYLKSADFSFMTSVGAMHLKAV